MIETIFLTSYDRYSKLISHNFRECCKLNIKRLTFFIYRFVTENLHTKPNGQSLLNVCKSLISTFKTNESNLKHLFSSKWILT